MSDFVLSADTKSVVALAQQIAKKRKHVEVDSAHLFCLEITDGLPKQQTQGDETVDSGLKIILKEL